MRHPDIENTGPQDIQVNVAARMENLEKDIIATGFCDGSHENTLFQLFNTTSDFNDNNVLIMCYILTLKSYLL